MPQVGRETVWTPPAGTAGQLLTKQSETTGDLTYLTPPVLQPYATGAVFQAQPHTAPPGTLGSMNSGPTWYWPIWVPAAGTIADARLISSAAQLAQTITCGLNAAQANGQPGALLGPVITTSMTPPASGGFQAAAWPSGITVPAPGWIYLAINVTSNLNVYLMQAARQTFGVSSPSTGRPGWQASGLPVSYPAVTTANTYGPLFGLTWR